MSNNSLIMYIAFNVLVFLALVALDQIPLIKDLIAASGYSAPEVLSGIGAIVFCFTTLIFALTYSRGRW